METLVREEADLLPVGARYVIATCVEVAQQHDVLKRERAETVSTTPRLNNLIILCILFLD